MSDLLETAIDYLDDVRKAYVSQTVVYARGGSTVSLVATPTQQEFATDNMDGTITTLVVTSWFVTVADLTLAPPKRGDQIRWTRSGTTHVYEVMGPGGRGPVYDDADPYRTAYKIHTKYVGTA